ncbi:ABC transporter ATP-binding protein [Desulfohalobiaceae bacterium Ax17]|uniref:ABC transporter ATP-binding protein n=1 Tax=Desulfovulcanus ferrireducens TaxID=2831190 RepID=UPI00336A3056|nr:ABC transporter ATP-binding protein [Desulfovulcanus ferrireducens]
MSVKEFKSVARANTPKPDAELPARQLLVSLKNIAHFFGQRLIFKDINLEILSGRVYILAGPNGAGKSTLLKIMAEIIEPSQGEVRLTLPREQIAYLGHQTFIYSSLSALENLNFWNSMYGLSLSEEELVQILKRVDLGPFVYEKAGNFSRGMAQRLSLARVIMLKPRLLFLDEPGTGLDKDSRDRLISEIEIARNDGAGVVWISHDIEEFSFSDHIFFLQGKKIVFSGPSEDFSLEGANDS